MSMNETLLMDETSMVEKSMDEKSMVETWTA